MIEQSYQKLKLLIHVYCTYYIVHSWLFAPLDPWPALAAGCLMLVFLQPILEAIWCVGLPNFFEQKLY